MRTDVTEQPPETRCRALSTPFLEDFASANGLYRPLTDLVVRNKDLHLELHGQLGDPNKPEIAPADEAVGIYYKGNCILGLNSRGKVELHDAFTDGLDMPRYLRKPNDVSKYLVYVPELMYRVASGGKKSMEIEYEQMIIRANNREERNNSEYIILTNQYKVGGRWDLLALKWLRRGRSGTHPTGQLVLMEVKYALNSDIRNAAQQLARYYDYINCNLDRLCTEMELILRQKLVLGLIERDSPQKVQLHKLRLIRDISKVEVVLFLVDYNPNSIWKDKMIGEAMRLPFRNQIRIRLGGLAMWDLSSTSLEKAAQSSHE